MTLPSLECALSLFLRVCVCVFSPVYYKKRGDISHIWIHIWMFYYGCKDKICISLTCIPLFVGTII